MGLLNQNGPVNGVLQASGLIDGPLELLQTDLAVVMGIAYAYLPFMILLIYAVLARLDVALLEAAADLGARHWRRFWNRSRSAIVAWCRGRRVARVHPPSASSSFPICWVARRR